LLDIFVSKMVIRMFQQSDRGEVKEATVLSQIAL